MRPGASLLAWQAWQQGCVSAGSTCGSFGSCLGAVLLRSVPGPPCQWESDGPRRSLREGSAAADSPPCSPRQHVLCERPLSTSIWQSASCQRCGQACAQQCGAFHLAASHVNKLVLATSSHRPQGGLTQLAPLLKAGIRRVCACASFEKAGLSTPRQLDAEVTASSDRPMPKPQRFLDTICEGSTLTR